MSKSPMSQLSRSELEFLKKAIKKGQLPAPVSELGLQSVGKAGLFTRLGPLAEANEPGALALIEMALAAFDGSPGKAVQAAPADLVWTGPNVHLSKTRPTTAVVLEMLQSARERVLIAGYEFDHGAVIFAPLHAVMRDHGVKASIYLHVERAPSPKTKMDSYLAIRAHNFLKRNWPFGEPVPRLFYFPAGTEHGSHKSLHAKCIVVDGKRVLIGSANFTKRGHARNVEVGVCIENPGLAETLTHQFVRLAEAGDLAPLPAPLVAVVIPPAEIEDDEAPKNPTTWASEHDRIADELFVSPEARPLLLRVLSQGLSAPLVGEDVEGDDGAVIGSPELSWEEQRVAVLLPEQEGCKKKLESAGWACFSVDLGADEFVALCGLIAKEG